MINNKTVILSNILRGRNINTKVIPTVCNLKPMLKRLKEYNWDKGKLKQWECRSYKAYHIDKIVHILKESDESLWPEVIKLNILTMNGDDIGANCLDIYFVAYISENYGIGREVMFDYCKDKRITEKFNSINAIYSVGKGDGIYLGLLNNDGTIKDSSFFRRWISS